MIGAILLIAGTAIGAGMLALPLVTASLGFFPSLVVFFISWSLMLYSAFVLVQVNMRMPRGTNLISMAHRTLGSFISYVVWFLYLVLFYAVLAAYMVGSAPLAVESFSDIGLQFSMDAGSFVILFLLGPVVGGCVCAFDCIDFSSCAIFLLTAQQLELRVIHYICGDYVFWLS